MLHSIQFKISATQSGIRGAGFTVRFASAILIAVVPAGMTGCSGSPSGRNSNLNANNGAAANTNQSAPTSTRFSPKEPDPYVATLALAQQGQPQVQIEIAKMRGDRRWALQLAGIGQVVYLEKAGLRYVMLPTRKQYAEMPSNVPGFIGGRTLTPTAMVDKLGKTGAEKIGKEAINGVMAIKYRLAGGQGKTGDRNNLVYVDEGSGLPVHIEADLEPLNGAAGRSVVDVLNVRLNPEAAMFDVPTGTKKVGAEQVKTQIDALAAALKGIAALMGERTTGSTAQITAPQPPTNANRPASEADSKRRSTGSPARR